MSVKSAQRIKAVTDTPERARRLQSALQSCAKVDYVNLAQAHAARSPADDLVIWADLKAVDTILAIRSLIDMHRDVERRFFVIDDVSHLASAQAYALGATHVLMADRSLSALQTFFIQSSSLIAEGTIEEAVLGSIQELKNATILFASGGEVDVASLESCADPTISALTQNGISGWLDVVRGHHEATYQHALLVTGVLVDFGISLGMRSTDLRKLHLAAMLHDIGKAKIPIGILDKPGRLADAERAIIELHPVIAFEALKRNSRVPAEVLDAGRHHHEYLDGSGYPMSVKGDKIHPYAKLIAIADVFDAMTSVRSYGKRATPYEAVEIMKREMVGKLDYQVCSVFLDKLSQRFVGDIVQLSNGQRGEVVFLNPHDCTRPIVRTRDGEFVDLDKLRDLSIHKMLHS